MKKITLTESDLVNLVKKVISEQTSSKHPTEDSLYINFTRDVEGDNVTGKKIDKNTLEITCGWGPVYLLKKIK